MTLPRLVPCLLAFTALVALGFLLAPRVHADPAEWPPELFGFWQLESSPGARSDATAIEVVRAGDEVLMISYLRVGGLSVARGTLLDDERILWERKTGLAGVMRLEDDRLVAVAPPTRESTEVLIRATAPDWIEGR